MSIKPERKSGSGYACGVPTCSTLPSYSKELQTEKGVCAACKIDEYCCTGAFNDPKQG